MIEQEIQGFLRRYTEALNVLTAKFNELYQEYQLSGGENPIEHFKYRIKSEKSIRQKLARNNFDYTMQNIKDHIEDVIGIRIICTFLSDIEEIIDRIVNDFGLEIAYIKDYISKPKESGYSSYHIFVKVPVNIDGQEEYVLAEIQIRTMAMDLWASIDHKLRYKKDIDSDYELNYKLNEIGKYVNRIDQNIDSLDDYDEKRMPVTKELINKLGTKEEYQHFILKYRKALQIVNDRFRQIRNSHIGSQGISPIEHIKGRIKNKEKMVSKLLERNKEISFKNLEYFVTDIGATKIVCSYLSDVAEIIDIIRNEPDFIILDEQDYITNPKDCGYSAYHFVVAVRVEVDGEVNYVQIEIIVRTMCMEFWANIEHKLCYQKNASQKRKSELQEIAHSLQIIDVELDAVNERLSQRTLSLQKHNY